MPKKHTFNFKQLTGASSSSKHPAANNGDDSNNSSVNERLSELRKLEGKEAAAKKRALAESVNQRSVPPELHGILGRSDSAPPKPKVALRFRDRLRTPGPAPPRSWVTRSAGGLVAAGMRGGRRLKNGADVLDRSRPEYLFRFDDLTGSHIEDIGNRVPSLLHLALKATAESWHLLDEEDYPAPFDIPLRLRLKILSYIGFYGAPIDSRELQAILQGTESVRHLDLASLVGHQKLSLKKLHRLIEDDRGHNTAIGNESVQDSWDAEADSEVSLSLHPSIPMFANMTHLCLSHPGPSASWKELLAMSKMIPQVTHLSLAYWPRPTLTPNLATTTVSSRTGDITAGGSHYYSALDLDMTEPASLIRQLSANLLCLQWLDLEGCHAWIYALLRLAKSARTNTADESSDSWGDCTQLRPSIFLSNWKNLSYIRCAQGWLPNLLGLSKLPAREVTVVNVLIVNVIIEGITKFLQQARPVTVAPDEPSQDVLDAEKKKAVMWLEAEHRCVHAGMEINACRSLSKIKLITIDHGWVKRHDAAFFA